MKCKKAQRMVSVHLDGELAEGAAAALQAHLDSCPACEEEYEGMKKTEKYFTGEAAGLSPYFRMNFWKKVEKDKERANIFYRKLIFFPAYAALGLFLMITFFSSTLLYAFRENLKDGSVRRGIAKAYINEGVLAASLTPVSCYKFFAESKKCVIDACCMKNDECLSGNCDHRSRRRQER